MSKPPVFKMGDAIRSAAGSGDITMMGLCWHGHVVNIYDSDTAPDNRAYETLGRWRVVDKKKTIGWYKPSAKLTLRQLWCNHLEMDVS
jgi:hypothetical protein